MKLEVETPVHLVDINRLDLATGSKTPRMAGCASARWCATATLPQIPVSANATGTEPRPAGRRERATAQQGHDRRKSDCSVRVVHISMTSASRATSACLAPAVQPWQASTACSSVLGGSDQCIATNPSDMAVAMRALDADVETVDGSGKSRVIPIADFHRLPGTTPQIDTNLKAGELITAVTLPPPPPGRQIYRKIRDRASYAFALVSVAAVVDAVGGRIRSARIACGGLAPKPWRVGQAEATLTGAAGKCAQLRCCGYRIARRSARLRFQRFQRFPWRGGAFPRC